MNEMWLVFTQAFTLVSVIVMLLYLLPLPVFDRSNATLMCASLEMQIATARALSAAVGEPSVELNTNDVSRFLYRDGTSVDSLVHPPRFPPMYNIIAMKSV